MPEALASLPQQIIVPRVGPSFGDPAPISNGAFLAATAPYRWLGAVGGYGGVAPLIGATPYAPAASAFGAFTPGLGIRSFGGWGPSFGGFGGYGGYGALGLGGLGYGYHGFGGGLGLGGMGMGLGFGSPLGGFGGYGGIGGLGYGGMGGFGGLSGLGGFGGYGHYRGFGGGVPFGYGGGYGMGMMGMGMGGMGMGGMGMGGMGMGFGGNSSEFGRLTNTRVFQTAPSKASGNYYAPSTPDPTASGSYYGSNASTSLVFPTSHQSSPQSYTKPQRNYWGSGGNPFPQDANSVPWSK